MFDPVNALVNPLKSPTFYICRKAFPRKANLPCLLSSEVPGLALCNFINPIVIRLPIHMCNTFGKS